MMTQPPTNKKARTAHNWAAYGPMVLNIIFSTVFLRRHYPDQVRGYYLRRRLYATPNGYDILKPSIRDTMVKLQ